MWSWMRLTRYRRPTSITLMKERSLEEECKRQAVSHDWKSLYWESIDVQLSADHLPVMLIRVQRLIAGFVAFNSPLEIQHCLSLVAVPVVRTRHLHFLHREGQLWTKNILDARKIQIFGTRTRCDVMLAAHHDVRSYDTWVITDRFDKKYLGTKRGGRSNLLLSQVVTPSFLGLPWLRVPWSHSLHQTWGSSLVSLLWCSWHQRPETSTKQLCKMMMSPIITSHIRTKFWKTT